MTFEQSLAAESASAEAAGVAVVVVDEGVFTQGGFGVEEDAATLQHLGAGLVHGQHVALQVVAPVSRVAALGAGEQLPAVVVAGVSVHDRGENLTRVNAFD